MTASYVPDPAPVLDENGLLHHLFRPMTEPEPLPETETPEPEPEIEP